MSRSGTGGWSASAWDPISPDSSAANPAKIERAAGPHPASHERLGRGEDRRRSRRVVLRAVVDRVAIDGRADAEVIVVAADQHRLAWRGGRVPAGGRARWPSRCGGWRSGRPPPASTAERDRLEALAGRRRGQRREIL